jgi:hypothetical protein
MKPNSIVSARSEKQEKDMRTLNLHHSLSGGRGTGNNLYCSILPTDLLHLSSELQVRLTLKFCPLSSYRNPKPCYFVDDKKL